MPASTSSSGTVIRFSTSAGDSPMPRVWISTLGGENSGNTSTGIFLIWPTPTSIRPSGEGDDEEAEPQGGGDDGAHQAPVPAPERLPAAAVGPAVGRAEVAGRRP